MCGHNRVNDDDGSRSRETMTNISHNVLSSYAGSISTACRDLRLGLELGALAKDTVLKELL